MKVFVAGSTGVAGRAVVPALAAAGHEVTAAVRSPMKADLVRACGASPVQVDLFDPAALRPVVAGQDVVCNLATHIPPLTRAMWRRAWQPNDRLRREVSASLAEAASDGRCPRMIQESIGFLYPDMADTWIDEQVELAPTVLTASARDAETNAARLQAAGGVTIVLRFGQFYGPGSTHSSQSMALASRFGIGPFPGDPCGYSSWIHSADLGPAVLAALTAPAGAYNVCDDEPLRRNELHTVIARALGRRRLHDTGKLAARLGGRKVQAISRSQRLSHATFTRATGWTPTVHPRHGWAELATEWASST